MLADLEIVDSHLHVWDLGKLQLAWLHDSAYHKIARTFSIDEYRNDTYGYNVSQAVYVEVDSLPTEQQKEADFVETLVRRSGDFVAGAVLGGRPDSPHFSAYVERLRDAPFVRGIREVLFDRPAGHCLRPSFLDGIRLLGDVGLSFEIEIPCGQLSEARSLADSCPGTPFVLDHCGHPDVTAKDLAAWKDHLAAVAECDNLVVKTSGLFSGVDMCAVRLDAVAASINYLFDVFGPDRVMFGSDWPVVTLTSSFREWVEAVWQAVSHRSQTELHRLFHLNARRVYRLHDR